jgi:hypothetical protein
MKCAPPRLKEYHMFCTPCDSADGMEKRPLYEVKLDSFSRRAYIVYKVVV